MLAVSTINGALYNSLFGGDNNVHLVCTDVLDLIQPKKVVIISR